MYAYVSQNKKPKIKSAHVQTNKEEIQKRKKKFVSLLDFPFNI